MQRSALDPRLRRLLGEVRVPVDLDLPPAELGPGFEASRDASAVDIPVVQVLVRVSGDPPLNAIPGSVWRQVADGIHVVELPVTALEVLAGLREVQYVEAARPLAPQLIDSLPEVRADRLHDAGPDRSALTGKGVVVGIIDEGIDFTLDDFVSPDGSTRLAFLWDQRLDPQGAEHPPTSLGFGVEYDAAALNAALASPNPFDAVRHRPRPMSHGTHVAGIAAGNGRTGDSSFPAGEFIGVAPDATIIFVQLRTSGEAGSFGDSPNAALAIRYIYDKASELGLPCVINMSLNQCCGGHDGSSLVEQTIDRLLEHGGRAFVHAAGNDHSWRNHSSATVAEGEEHVMRWTVGGGRPIEDGEVEPSGPDPTPNELEIWHSPGDTFAVRLVQPGGEATSVVEPGGAPTEHRFGDGNVAWMSAERFSPLNGDSRIYIDVQPGDAATVASGTWEVRVTGVGVRLGRLDAWLERDVRVPAARQSFFPDSDFDPETTLGIPATTRNGITVANYATTPLELSASSGRGRTRDGREKPEIVAPGTRILSSGALGGRTDEATGLVWPVRVAKSGTSMSAPHVAGVVALLLQRSPELTAPQIRKILMASARPVETQPPFDVGWGYGRLDAEAALRELS